MSMLLSTLFLKTLQNCILYQLPPPKIVAFGRAQLCRDNTCAHNLLTCQMSLKIHFF